MADEDKRKHLDLLQNAVARLAGNSFLLKGWSVTLATAMLGLSAKEAVPRLALLALVPIAAFFALDAYYLGLERRFRDLYNAAVSTPTETDFTMTPKSLDLQGWLEALCRPAVVFLHLPLALAALGVYISLRCCVGR